MICFEVRKFSFPLRIFKKIGGEYQGSHTQEMFMEEPKALPLPRPPQAEWKIP